MTTPDAKAKSGARPKTKVRYFRMRNRLKAKTGGGGPESGPPTLAGDALERAMSEMKKAEEDYPDWVLKSLTELNDEYKAAAESEDRVERNKRFKRICDFAHELKGQGGPRCQVVGIIPNDFTFGEVAIGESQLEIVKSHIDVMRAVINDRIAGDGGEIGQALVASLDQAIKKHS